jgi:hypothetical protein
MISKTLKEEHGQNTTYTPHNQTITPSTQSSSGADQASKSTPLTANFATKTLVSARITNVDPPDVCPFDVGGSSFANARFALVWLRKIFPRSVPEAFQT